jgi:hypothetical protein
MELLSLMTNIKNYRVSTMKTVSILFMFLYVLGIVGCVYGVVYKNYTSYIICYLMGVVIFEQLANFIIREKS